MLRADVLPVDRNDPTWTGLVAEVRRYVRGRVGSSDAAEDLVQEVFVRVHDRIDQLRDTERLAGWIQRIATHVVADHHRRRRDAAPLADEPVADTAADEADLGPLAAWVGASIDRLDPPYREVLALTELGGKTQREVAEALGLSLSAVKSRVRRGRAKVEQMVRRCCHVELDARGGIVDYHPRQACDTACCPQADG